MPRPWSSCILILDPRVATCTRGYWGYRFILAPPVGTLRLSASHGAGLAREWLSTGKQKLRNRLSTAVADAWRSLTLHLDTCHGCSGKALQALAWDQTTPPTASGGWNGKFLHNTTLGPPYLELRAWQPVTAAARTYVRASRQRGTHVMVRLVSVAKGTQRWPGACNNCGP
jgi:hypothetical protein